MDNSNSILFLSSTISVLLSEMERYLALHERVKSELDHILDALDNLSNNLLSHSVVRPSVLKRMIEHVKQQLAEKYTTYELVIANILNLFLPCWDLSPLAMQDAFALFAGSLPRRALLFWGIFVRGFARRDLC